MAGCSSPPGFVKVAEAEVHTYLVMELLGR